jgi:hypothetical protein
MSWERPDHILEEALHQSVALQLHQELRPSSERILAIHVVFNQIFVSSPIQLFVGADVLVTELLESHVRFAEIGAKRVCCVPWHAYFVVSHDGVANGLLVWTCWLRILLSTSFPKSVAAIVVVSVVAVFRLILRYTQDSVIFDALLIKDKEEANMSLWASSAVKLLSGESFDLLNASTSPCIVEYFGRIRPGHGYRDWDGCSRVLHTFLDRVACLQVERVA